jgi:thiamine transporter ThiT
MLKQRCGILAAVFFNLKPEILPHWSYCVVFLSKYGDKMWTFSRPAEATNKLSVNLKCVICKVICWLFLCSCSHI